MKNIHYIPLVFITMVVALCSCAVKSDICDAKHPHTDKLIITAQWDEVQKTANIPTSLQLYYWENNATQPEIKETSADNTGRFFFDLPKPGNYNMLLVGKLSDDYFSINNQAPYKQFNGLISLTPKLTNALYAQDLGRVIIKDNTSIFLDSKIRRYSRNMNIKVIVDNMYEEPVKATLDFSGFSTGVNMCDKQYFGSYNLEVPLELKNNLLQTSITYLKSDGTNNIFSLSLTNSQGITITRNIDFTESILKFEEIQPYTNDINVEAAIQFTRLNGKFDFVIKYITIDGNEVYRNINT